MTQSKQNNNIGSIAHQSLSVQLALTGHSFLITHTQTKEVLFFSETIFKQATTPQDLQLDLSQKIENTPELKHNFDHVVLIH